MAEKQLIIEEFENRVFFESYERIFKCLSMVDEKDVWHSPNSTITSIGCLIQHLNGNVRQWILSGIGKQPNLRNREEEFVQHFEKTKNVLIKEMKGLQNELIDFFENNSTINLQQKITVQNFNLTTFSAIIHVIEHYSYHTGQITTITKLLTNKETGYYENYKLD